MKSPIDRVSDEACHRLVDQAHAVVTFAGNEGVHLDVADGTDLREIAVEHVLALGGYSGSHGFSASEILTLFCAVENGLNARLNLPGAGSRRADDAPEFTP